MKVMGIDLGIRKIAYANWQDGRLVETDAWESQADLRHMQLMDLGDTIYEAVKYTEPDHVFIEDTLVGNNVKYSIQLAQVMGSVLSSLALLQVEQYFGLYLVNNKVWKKTVLQNGNAGKDIIRSWVTEQDSAYSVLCGNDQDRFDAACIGYYGTIIEERAGVLADV